MKATVAVFVLLILFILFLNETLKCCCLKTADNKWREAFLHDFNCLNSLFAGCVLVAEEEAHRKWHCGHCVPRRKHTLCARHDCLQFSPRLHRGPSCQPVLERRSLQGKCSSLAAWPGACGTCVYTCYLLTLRCRWQHGTTSRSLARLSQILLSLQK